jgi:UDPglucose 6-dehydrogenase
MIGTGYVGLVSGACFSDFGHVVTCIDKDSEKIERLCKGSIPIFEPGLEALVASNVKAGRLAFTTETGPAIREADAVFLAVGTPSRRGDGFADLSHLHGAAREIAPEMEGFTVIVIKSTDGRIAVDERNRRASRSAATTASECGLPSRSIAVIGKP